MAKARSTVSKRNLPDGYLAEVEKMAYEFFLERRKKQIQGDQMSDWFKAEQAVKAKYQI